MEMYVLPGGGSEMAGLVVELVVVLVDIVDVSWLDGVCEEVLLLV